MQKPESFWVQSVSLLGLGLFALGCSPDIPATWNQAELDRRLEEFGHIAEAYAVVDLCMPMIDSDPDAKHSLISHIDIRSYSKLKGMNTEAELQRFLAHHRSGGASEEQLAQLEAAYRVAYEEAQPHLRSLNICLDTVADYTHTILNTTVNVSQ